MNIKFNIAMPAGYENCTVCNEPLFLCVQNILGEIPSNVECEASPLAFALPRQYVEEAKNAILENKTVEVGERDNIVLRFTNRCDDFQGNKYIECKTVRSFLDFYEAAERVKMEVIFGHIEKGVIFVSVDGVVVSPFAKIGSGTVIHPMTEIRGNSSIGNNCTLGPCSVIENSVIGDECKVNASHIYGSELKDGVSIGPFSHVKAGSTVCAGAKIGDFVEIKNSVVGEGTKAAHLTYIGDSNVGSNVNFGCGTVVSNYDGKYKYRTAIGDNVFIGCNTNLVAPVTVNDGAFIAAGSTVTSDVPEGALAIARSRQINKEGWADARRKEGKLK